METQHPLPAFDANAIHNEMKPTERDDILDGDANEPDTCRICRGPAEDDHQLFYPCKCNGSIKYVHQDCLMEWLEHSQKKHCELCKTPFRFTKLYEHDMPQQLPLLVFYKHMVIHGWDSVKTWSRGTGAAFVWLAALPWVMKHVWAMLFYLADGGWSLRYPNLHFLTYFRSDSRFIRTAQEVASSFATWGTSLASPLVEGVTDARVYDALRASSEYMAVLNNDALAPTPIILWTKFYETGLLDMPLFSRVLEAFYTPFGKPDIDPSNYLTAKIVTDNMSLLSGFHFINNLTSSPAFNRLFVTCLEGLVITASVVICFILVFLIREWVVQQQPGINVGAGFDAQFPNNRLRPVVAGAGPNPADAEELQRVFRVLEELGQNQVAAPERFDRVGGERALAGRADADLARFLEHGGQNADERRRAIIGAQDGQLLRVPDGAVRDQDQYGELIDELRNGPVAPERMNQIIEMFRTMPARRAAAIQHVDHHLHDLPLNPAADQDDAQRAAASDGDDEAEPDHVHTEQQLMRDAPDVSDTAVSSPLNVAEELPSRSWHHNDFDSSTDVGHTSPPDTASNSHNLARLIEHDQHNMGYGDEILPEPDSTSADSIRADDGFSNTDVEDEERAGTDNTNEVASEDGWNENENDEPEAVQDTIALAGNPRPTQPAVPAAPQPEGFFGHLAHWMWGDIVDAAQATGADDEHIVQDVNEEAPFVPVREHRAHFHEDIGVDAEPEPAQNLEPGAFEEIDPMDPDAVDDAEDMDGIMELLGMRGPITGLVQNAMFGVIIIAITIFVAVWIPYCVGRFTLIVVANPIPAIKLPLRVIFRSVTLFQDLALMVFGSASYLFMQVFGMVARTSSDPRIAKAVFKYNILAKDTIRYAAGALQKILIDIIETFTPNAEIPQHSAESHEALIIIKSTISYILSFGNIFELFQVTTIDSGVTVSAAISKDEVLNAALAIAERASKWIKDLPVLLAKPETWVISLAPPARAEPLDMALTYWSGFDHFLAVMTGYATFFVAGAAYVRKGSPFSTSNTGRNFEAQVIDALNQAGGVLKVILIISIEMLVFPLYCGLLLDLATLPLFDGATFTSRVVFFLQSPFTSMFIHWFVGTCYMFHFALFVSMCRKILRTGVLYFIRDPDDPHFHPVRDVLERNVATQLRKITFSALVYGALVLVCLGGVVWSLSYIFVGVLPIRWSSNEPVLEFPIDLLFYNFLMPLAVKFVRPSAVLRKMYKWWFSKCAHYLRLSHFLLNKRVLSEEVYPVDCTNAEIASLSDKELKEFIEQGKIPLSMQYSCDSKELALVKRGRYVRAPASDLVRVPKNQAVFFPVTPLGEPLSGTPTGVHATNAELFKVVYAPPWFRTRICAFIIMLWAFAAVTGCSLTLLPLVLGRRIFEAVLPQEVVKNDVYAFAMGANIVGGAAYLLYHLRHYLISAYTFMSTSSPRNTARTALKAGLKAAKCVYVYTSFLLILPSLLAFTTEFYIIIPLHHYISNSEPHTIHFVQTWTLGLLLLNLLRRFLLWREGGWGDSAYAAALRRIVARGWLDPGVGLATRAVILPACVVFGAALAVPPALARVLVGRGEDVEWGRRVYRMAYPGVLGAVLYGVGLWQVMGWAEAWRRRVRDEVYLIGERLHNFGEEGKRGRTGGRGLNRVAT